MNKDSLSPLHPSRSAFSSDGWRVALATVNSGSGPALAVRHGAFAALATAVTVATQALSFVLYAGRYELYVAMAAAPLAGLLAKYALTGVLTTCIFWATELTVAALGDARWLPFSGAVLGLSAGYAIKSRLDRRFVFRRAGV